MKHDKIKLAALLLIIVVPITLATFSFILRQDGGVASTTNKGRLISPVLDVTELDMRDADGTPLFQRFEESVEGIDPADYDPRPWMLVFLGDNQCDEACQERLYFLRQLHRRLGAESERVRRYYLNVGMNGGEQPMAQDAREFFDEFLPEMTVARAREEVLRGNLARTHGEAEDPVEDHYIYVVDPVGNVMLYFTPENSPEDILTDIDKLLDQSSLG